MILEIENNESNEFTAGDLLIGEVYSFVITYYDVVDHLYAVVSLDGLISTSKLCPYTKEELLTWIANNELKIYSKNNYKLKLVQKA